RLTASQNSTVPLGSAHRHPNGGRKIVGADSYRDFSVPPTPSDGRRLLLARHNDGLEGRFARMDPRTTWRLPKGRPSPFHRQEKGGRRSNRSSHDRRRFG